jgi:AcrR family transcriptional regulator
LAANDRDDGAAASSDGPGPRSGASSAPGVPGAPLLPGELERPVWDHTRRRRVAEIVAAARSILEEGGEDALTMRRVADELGIQAPSLYKHFASKGELELALLTDAMVEIGEASHHAIHSGGDGPALRPLLETYRGYSLSHPHLYRLATAGPLVRDGLPAGLEEWAGNPWYVVTGDPYLAQALWSFAHGMVVLELDGRYPPGSDLGATWAAGAEAFEVLAAHRRAKARPASAQDFDQQDPGVADTGDDTE